MAKRSLEEPNTFDVNKQLKINTDKFDNEQSSLESKSNDIEVMEPVALEQHIVQYICENNYDMVKLLLSNGYDPDNAIEYNKEEVPLLSLAIRQEKENIALLLIDSGVKIPSLNDMRDYYEVSPLIDAIENDMFNVAKSLIEHGHPINYIDEWAEGSPLKVAITCNSLTFVEYLLECGANPFLVQDVQIGQVIVPELGFPFDPSTYLNNMFGASKSLLQVANNQNDPKITELIHDAMLLRILSESYENYEALDRKMSDSDFDIEELVNNNSADEDDKTRQLITISNVQVIKSSLNLDNNANINENLKNNIKMITEHNESSSQNTNYLSEFVEVINNILYSKSDSFHDSEHTNKETLHTHLEIHDELEQNVLGQLYDNSEN